MAVRPPRAVPSEDVSISEMSLQLDAQLGAVVEQDGVTMLSSQGIRQSVPRVRRAKKKNITTDDDVAERDRQAVELIVRPLRGLRERVIEIRYVEHSRSAHVVSIRGLAMNDASRDRSLRRWSPVSAITDIETAKDVSVYASLTRDLTTEAVHPHFHREQLTPGTFDEAYQAVYGRWERVTRLMVRAGQEFIALFHRVERIERVVADEVRETMEVVEVPRLSFARVVAGFAFVLMVMTLPAQAVSVYRNVSETRDVVQDIGTRGINEARAAQGAGSLSSSIDSLRQASLFFREADAVIGRSGALALALASVVPSQYRSARALLEVGDKASEAGRLFAVGFEKALFEPSRRLDERFEVIGAYARGVLPLLTDAEKAASSVDIENIPEDQRDGFASLTSALADGVRMTREAGLLSEAFANFVGKDHARTYLLVFQNQTELRPSGGFMGSIAEVTFDRGELKKIRVPPGGTYDLKGQLLARVVSPQPLHLINPLWQFQDANWSPDFVTTAQTIRWFWSKSGQPTIDGVIAVNASFMERILEVTGPIDMPEYGKIINAENFLFETQKAVEVEYDREANTPKKFIGDLFAVMLDRMKGLEKDQWLKLFVAMSEAIQTKEVQVALTNPEEDALAERYGWRGMLKPAPGDSLAIIEANIAGQKTDGVIDEHVEHLAEIQPDGSIIDTVRLTRTHQGIKGEPFRGVRNVSYVRIYVPQGSELISAEGHEAPPASLFKKPQEGDEISPLTGETDFKTLSNGLAVSTEADRTVFGGWLQLDPGETQTITYRYLLPFTVQDLRSRFNPDRPTTVGDEHGAYLLLLTSQSGKESRQLRSTVRFSDAWRSEWQRGVTPVVDGLIYEGVWDRDRVVAAIVQPN